uniref:Malectin-like domain-containing protein n=1 Tax=Aegilops tauschii subsp. strangulata TaxID=200361 RepID=A0A452ZLN8_AEGTS
MCARSRTSQPSMAAQSSLTLLLSLTAAAVGALQARGQRVPSLEGFITIGCGLQEQSSYTAPITKIPTMSDASYNYNISAEYMKPQPVLARSYHTVRGFPDTPAAATPCRPSYRGPSTCYGPCSCTATTMGSPSSPSSISTSASTSGGR